MRNLLLALTGVAFVAGILSAHLWRELRATRLMAVQLHGQLAAVQGLAARTPPAEDAGRSMATAAFPAVDAGQPAPVANGEAATPGNPGYRTARLARSVAMMRRIHAAAATELGLSAEEAEALFALLAEHDVDLESIAKREPALHDPALLQQQLQQFEAITQRQRAAIELQLGGRYPQWQDYEASRPVRLRVEQLRATLSSSGLPLDDAEARIFVTALVPEQKRTEEALLEMARGGSAAGASLEEAFRIQADGDRRMLDVARAHLDEKRLQAFAAMIESEQAKVRARLRPQASQSAQAP